MARDSITTAVDREAASRLCGAGRQGETGDSRGASLDRETVYHRGGGRLFFLEGKISARSTLWENNKGDRILTITSSRLPFSTTHLCRPPFGMTFVPLASPHALVYTGQQPRSLVMLKRISTSRYKTGPRKTHRKFWPIAQSGPTETTLTIRRTPQASRTVTI